MSGIDLKQFVDINIKSHVSSVVNGTRDTIVLFTSEGIVGTQKLISSMSQASSTYSASTAPNTLAYLTMYFNNGGVNVLVIEGTAYTDITAETIANLDNSYIGVAYAASNENVEDVYAALKAIAQTREASANIYGINEKIILASTKVKTDSDLVKNFAVKYSNVQGAEMTMAAYLSQVNVYGVDTIYDYAFTKEVIDEEPITNTEFTQLMNNNINVDADLANAVRNCGGNCKDGSDLVNTYVKIILHQTLTDVLVNLMSQKLKGSIGLSKIYTAISQELEKYLACGYLTTDKIWTDETLTTVKNNVTYTIIEKGTPLTNGYNITVLPMSSLSQTDKAAHKAPAIYVIIADQYGIRHITINGEVI